MLNLKSTSSGREDPCHSRSFVPSGRRAEPFAAAPGFLACYQATTGTPLHDQPYWDLVALLDLLLDIGDSTGPGDIDPDDLHRFENYAKTALTSRP